MKYVGVLLLMGVLSSCSNNDLKSIEKVERWTNSKLKGVDVESSKNRGFDISDLDTNFSPQDDFYQFVNGGWEKKTVRPETEPKWGTFNILRENNDKRIESIINEIDAKEGKEQELIFKLYKSGMDIEKINSKGISPLKDMFDQIDRVKNKDDLMKLFGEFTFNSVKRPFSFYIRADSRNSEYNIPHLGQSGLGLPDRDYYIEDRYKDIREKYKKHISKALSLSKITNPDKRTEAIFDIETKLAKVSMSKVEMRDPEKTYNKLEYSDLKKHTPNMNWEVYFGQVDSIKIEHIVLTQYDYLKSLDEIFEESSLENWKDYSRWKVLDSYMSYLTTEHEEENFYFRQTVMNGVKVMKPREERMTKLVNSILSEPLGKVYVKKYFSEDSKNRIVEMIENIKLAYRDRIEKLEWMSDSTKLSALKKLEAFNYKVGYPDKWEKDYSNISLSEENFVENIMILSRFETKELLKIHNQKVDKSKWYMPPQMVNAYYSPLFNEIVFPAAILQPPFFDERADDAINYGGIGGVIAHEFTHGFDDKGSKYDERGNVRNWWTQEDRSNFEKRTEILVNQANETECIPGVFINGKLCLGENIADIGGVLLAYHALKKQLAKTEKIENIDGFTPYQRLFLSWARIWATLATDEYTKKQVATDPHSPGKFRAVNPMRNLKEFESAWGADESDKMVLPESERVKIW